MSRPLWSPSRERLEGSQLREFWRHAETETGRRFASYEALQRWSVESPDVFWRLAWDFCGVIGETGTGPALVDGDRMPGARFFPEASLNFAENLLRRDDDAEALVFRSEPGVSADIEAWLAEHPIKGGAKPTAQQLEKMRVRVGLREREADRLGEAVR